MKNKRILRPLATLLFIVASQWVQAWGLPKFSILAIIRAPANLPANGVAMAQYLVINNTQITRTLTMVPMPGVSQATGGCPRPFILASGQSCLLNVLLQANQMRGGVHTGPEVCKTLGPQNNSADPFLCSQAGLTDRFEVFVTQ